MWEFVTCYGFINFHYHETANLAGLNKGIGNIEAPLLVSDILQVKETIF
jgi:hypothetical protein